MRRATTHLAVLCAGLLSTQLSAHPQAAQVLPAQAFEAAQAPASPVLNSAFAPGPKSLPAAPFEGLLDIAPTAMKIDPVLEEPVILGRDARLFPGVRLSFLTIGDILVPVQRGSMVRETAGGAVPSYWRVIPQFGRIWREKTDGAWS